MNTASKVVSVLVVDDEPQMRRLLTVALEANGYGVVVAEKGQEALVLAVQYRPDLVLLDLGLPDLDGHTVLKRLREWFTKPIIVLTVRDSQEEKISALDHGADDYVTKPFHTGELLARMRAALRHASEAEPEAVFQIRDLVVDLACRRVTLSGQEVKLTATEYAILQLFVRHLGKVLTHRQILREVWGAGHEDSTHYLRVYMAHLREKLERKSNQPPFFVTEPGIGYRLSMD